MQTIMNEVVLGIKGEPNESAEAKEFRQGIIEPWDGTAKYYDSYD